MDNFEVLLLNLSKYAQASEQVEKVKQILASVAGPFSPR